MKIIYLCPSLDGKSGWSRYSHSVISRVATKEEVVVVCNQALSNISIRQLPVLRSPLSYIAFPLWIFIDAFRIRRLVAHEAAGHQEVMIHCTVEPYALFLPFFKGIRAKMLMTVHGTYSVLPLRALRTRFLYILMYRIVDRVISVSEYTKRHMLRHASRYIDASRIMVVLNGVDFLDRPQRDSQKQNAFKILTVGDVKRRKGMHHLVRVAKILRDEYDFPFQVTIVGKIQEGAHYTAEIRQYISENALEDIVHFAGGISQQELDKQYAESDVFALLSVHEHGHYEGYPLVFHEAAMWGLPVIGTFDCGAEDAIKNGDTGVLVHPENHREVAQAIADIRSGAIRITPETCRNWASENDWDRKDLMQMYIF